MGKHSARADRPPREPAAAAPGTGRRRAPDARGAAQAPGPGRRRAVGRDDGVHTGPTGAEDTRPSARGGHPEQRDPVAGRRLIGAQRAHAAPGAAPHGPTRYTTGQASFPLQAGGDGTPAAPRPRVPGQRRAAAGSGPRGTGSGMVRTVTGVAAALVTAVLAVVVAGQVDEGSDGKAQARSMDADRRTEQDAASRSDSRPTPKGAAVVPATYEEKMAKKYPLDATAGASGEFLPVPGHDKAPGKGEVLRYRVDVEKGLPLDGGLFADAVHRTLNDDRSWAHDGKRTFERVSSGDADFVITLASPRTTAAWCAKSGLDTTEDNVSCDSAATDRVMINAYRWAQGSQTYGDRMHDYRQMLINHEVGHRLGHDHESCAKEGALAPVMMQQTKFLTTDGATCRPNAWPYPDANTGPAS